MAYVRSLNFEEAPDYAVIRQMFTDLFFNLGYEYDGKFDWVVEKEKQVDHRTFTRNVGIRKVYER